MIYTSRPPANRKSARIAWDLLVDKRLPATIVRMRFVRFDYHDHAWAAEYTDGEWRECDSLVATDRVKNPHKYVASTLQQNT